jgi:nitroreductase
MASPAIEAARWAPSASNRQPYRFVAIEKPETRAHMAELVEEALREKLAEVASHHEDSTRIRTVAMRDERVLAEADMLYVILHIENATLEDSRRQHLSVLTRATRFAD